MLSPLDCRYYVGVIVILKIVISEFFPIHYTGHRISSLYQEYCYIEDRCIGVPLFFCFHAFRKIQLFLNHVLTLLHNLGKLCDLSVV